MTESQSKSPSYGTIPVSPELRDKIRLEKARKGISYDEYLRNELSLTE